MINNHIKVEPIATSCGAEIHGVDLSQELDDETLDEIKQAFRDHQVIFFRDQTLTEEQHMAFGQRFGTLNVHPRYVSLADNPEVFQIRKDPGSSKVVGGIWHQDLTHLPEPPLGSILYALETPPVGGDTLFANQYMAYESLSDGMKQMLAGLRAVHDNRIQSPKIAQAKNADMTTKLRDDADEAEEPESVHPVVITHPETGLKALYVNIGRSHRFADMTEEESRPLLDYLIEHSHKPEFT
ncbi:MAG: taurine dioxygenase, partial [Rhodospirillales bacterium]|nr:taurine dioxygenase [Rhodospirillales bacterium]